jgi:hypothetical protein
MSGIVLDAARAIEGLESVEALERLQGKRGLPDSETLLRVRVVGITPRLFGVTDGKTTVCNTEPSQGNPKILVQ